jgi:phosphate transport system permease protein
VSASLKPRARVTDLAARGETMTWLLGGALALGCAMIIAFLLMVLWNGIVTFWPKPIDVITLPDGKQIAGEPFRSELHRPAPEQLEALDPAARERIGSQRGITERTLYRIGNYDLYNEDFRWVSDHQIIRRERPAGLHFFERIEWGPFIGAIASVNLAGRETSGAALDRGALAAAHDEARARWREIRRLEHDEIGAINHALERLRLQARKRAITGHSLTEDESRQLGLKEAELRKRYDALAATAQNLKAQDQRFTITLREIGGREKAMRLSELVHFYPANELSIFGKLGVYRARWWEFLTDSPREANTEGGVLPAIFGTAVMTLLMVLVVAPFGVITALYLREYARQGRLVSIVRISVNNLAGVPSIVYGVFGLGFFAYIVGGSIDALFFPERLPSPTFGTGGLLWASLTLALLTVPVVIVATEEALAAVPRSMREGSLACGASKWQTIRRIVLPRAMPGIMTGLILAMARGAGEVAPLMLIGVVKLAPELPIDGYFPFVHLERSFMHLGFHIYDVGFQSRNSEAGKPMVFVTTLLLITLIAMMNASAIVIRNKLKKRYAGSTF